jgi:hypothetical protein
VFQDMRIGSAKISRPSWTLILSPFNRGVASARNPNDFPWADHAQATLTCLDLDEYRADVRDGADARTTQFHPVAYVEFHFRTSETSRKIAIMRIGRHRCVTAIAVRSRIGGRPMRGGCSTKVGLSHRANGLCTSQRPLSPVTAVRRLRPTTIRHDHPIDT